MGLLNKLAVVRRNLGRWFVVGYTTLMRVLYFGGIPLSVLYGK